MPLRSCACSKHWLLPFTNLFRNFLLALCSGTGLREPGVISYVSSQSLKCEASFLIFISGVQFSVDKAKGELFSFLYFYFFFNLSDIMTRISQDELYTENKTESTLINILLKSLFL